jgi:hypothetical protein
MSGVKIEPYDNEARLTEKHSMLVPDSIPAFFHLEKVKPGKDKDELSFSYVKEKIKNMSSIMLANESRKLLQKYPKLRGTELCLLWAETKQKSGTPPGIKDIETLRPIADASFNHINLKNALEQFRKKIQEVRDRTAEKLKREEEKYNVLKKQKGVDFGDFNIETLTYHILLEFKDGPGIMEIFDGMSTSLEIPFIMAILNNKKYYKIYEKAQILNQWLEKREEEGDGIYFKVLNIPTIKLTSKTFSVLENIYSSAYLSVFNILGVKHKIREGLSQEMFLTNIKNSFDLSIRPEQKNFDTTSLKGYFTVKDTSVDRIVFSDMVMNDEIVSFFLFVDESQETTLNKKRFQLHFAPDQKGIIDRAFALIFPEITTDAFNIRISKTKSIIDIRSTMWTLSKLFGLYDSQKQRIERMYKGYISTFVPFYGEKKSAVTIKGDRKTGKRALRLREADPDMFRARYPDSCQKGSQPEIIDEQQAKNIQTKNPHKIMEFKGLYYICDPRDPDEKSKEGEKQKLWPGLMIPKEPTTKMSAEQKAEMKKYREENPLVPCCYAVDQYTKAKSNLREYLEEKESGGKIIAASERYTGTHILVATKNVHRDRLGEVPHNWERILRIIGMQKIKKKNQKTYPFLRYGVEATPDSFFHCMERAFGKNYISADESNRKKIVMQRREQMAANSRLLAYSKQELFDYSFDQIRGMLLDKNAYLAPEKFVSMAEKEYDKNIIMFKTGPKTPDGEILLPASSGPYLKREIDPNRSTVIIFSYEIEGPDYPSQCEIGVILKGAQKKFDMPQNIAKIASEMFDNAIEVFSTGLEGVKKYNP